ncbi:hypothetical protein [Xanthomonas nasturtii]|uniref:hypothetical protein n=1 Tax=Xanthomonas nasturtii TaxID=1843581 RepID=UPI0020130A3F|nr:hypothetical protein [Xanthomonas nasturtii]MCL1500015.1 hypothetical protein [Xanthomonas nasturtii]MCL1503760.1 hypothetical protein [Xanthomonas nasturtii]MCL1521615.1 hypothetical protein [Xanthomonas nasturtii]
MLRTTVMRRCSCDVMRGGCPLQLAIHARTETDTSRIGVVIKAATANAINLDAGWYAFSNRLAILVGCRIAARNHGQRLA